MVARITAVLPVAERDAVSLCRRGRTARLMRQSTGEVLASHEVGSLRVSVARAQLPRRLTIGGHAQDPTNPDNQMQRGYYREEQRLGADFDKYAGMSKAEIRRVMAMPDAPESDE